jgi:hypothetical protein
MAPRVPYTCPQDMFLHMQIRQVLLLPRDLAIGHIDEWAKMYLLS